MTENNKEKENNKINEDISKEQKNIIMKNLIKENEILSKVIKGKITTNEALNELLYILNDQRNFIENISEEHFMLEKSVNRLNTSIDILKTKLKVTHEDLDLDIKKIINANKVTYKPNEAISFSNLNRNINTNYIKNSNSKKQLNTSFNRSRKLKTPIKINNTSSGNIDYDKLMQMSVSDFKKKKLKPINKKK